MLEQIKAGMMSEKPVEWTEILLKNNKEHNSAVDQLFSTDGIIFAYPLYTDSMPGIAVQFWETLLTRREDLTALEDLSIPAVFLVHSGFPEGVHTAHLPDIHSRICKQFGFQYMGTLRKPGSEAVRLMPPKMLKGLFTVLQNAGTALVKGKPPDEKVLDSLIRYERLGPWGRFMMNIASGLGLTSIYFKRMLRKHAAWAKRFDAPYGPAEKNAPG